MSASNEHFIYTNSKINTTLSKVQILHCTLGNFGWNMISNRQMRTLFCLSKTSVFLLLLGCGTNPFSSGEDSLHLNQQEKIQALIAVTSQSQAKVALSVTTRAKPIWVPL
jgi:hypothetical protein